MENPNEYNDDAFAMASMNLIVAVQGDVGGGRIS